jgi:hypothetical protein
MLHQLREDGIPFTFDPTTRELSEWAAGMPDVDLNLEQLLFAG